jgi:hypothetical protein
MSISTTERAAMEKAWETLRRSGNPFRNYFARNPDDEVCARYHVADLYASERELLLSVIDLYRYEPKTHSEFIPILGNKGSGKTHLLHSIKHGGDGAWQLLVTPGVYQKDNDFLEYLLFQIIDTLLGGGQQRGIRPLDYVSEHLVRRLLSSALKEISPEQRLDLFPAPGLGRWTRRLGLGHTQAQERCQWLIDHLVGYSSLSRAPMPVLQALKESGLNVEQAISLVDAYIDRTESRNTAGLMRREIYQKLARAHLLKDETPLADFLTYGFAELEFHVRPSRQDLVLALFKVMMEVFRTLKTPVVVAFDQLEDLLLARRTDDGHKIAESFFAGIVQAMHQIDGLCFLIFAERGLWNRFVPSLDGYIQDRLNNPVHVPRHGTVKTLRLEAPAYDLVKKVVESRLAYAMQELPEREVFPTIFPFTEEQLQRVARTEPTLRDMLQQYRHLFDHLVYGAESEVRNAASVVAATPGEFVEDRDEAPAFEVQPYTEKVLVGPANRIAEVLEEEQSLTNRITPFVPEVPQISVKSIEIIQATEPASIPTAEAGSLPNLLELWAQEQRASRRKLEPDGAITGATRELQAGLGAFLQTCNEHGVKVGPWRLQHVVPEYTFGEHPTYGVMSIAHWVCKDSQPWKVGVGLFLGRAAGKPRDLETKLSVLKAEPSMIDHLILMRPEDDLSLTGKTKSMWQEAEKSGYHARLEASSLDNLAMIYGFPRFLAALRESLPEGAPLPNLGDFIQEHCEKLLEQVCLPVQG